ncbi:transcriptional regulator with XRE-family HTH domain [Bradyrhizobium sp. USDA 4341]
MELKVPPNHVLFSVLKCLGKSPMSKVADLPLNDIVTVVTALGQALRRQRERLGMTPLEVSRKVNIGAKTIELVEDGKTDPQIDQVLCLVFHMGMDIKLPNSETPARASKLLEVRLADMRQAITTARTPEGQPRKVSLKTISDMSGIEQGQIGKIETGQIIPRFRTFLALMQALNVPVAFVQLDEKLAKSKKLPTAAPRPFVPRRKRTQETEDELASA